MKLTVVGSGDAFGSGGRLSTCFHVSDEAGTYLLDCGASATVGLNRLGLDFSAIGSIVISHLHGDHFAGLVFFVLHAQYVARRTAPLTVIGPPGIEARFVTACEALFPGSTTTARRHALTFEEITAAQPLERDGRLLRAYEVVHPSGAPSHALRIEHAGKTLAFSGDTGWTDVLLDVARGADLYISECYTFDRVLPYHIDWATLSAKLPMLAARRILVSHMGEDALARRNEMSAPSVLLAEDGLVIDV